MRNEWKQVKSWRAFEFFKIAIAFTVFIESSNDTRLILSLCLGTFACLGLCDIGVRFAGCVLYCYRVLRRKSHSTLPFDGVPRTGGINAFEFVDGAMVKCAIDTVTDHEEAFGDKEDSEALSHRLIHLSLENNYDETVQLLRDEENNKKFDELLIFPDQMLQCLVRAMSRSPSRYCYVRCLQREDQDTFIRAYIDALARGCKDFHQRRMIIESGGIRLGIWRRLMKIWAPKFNAIYHLHRHSYWGENTGSLQISQVHSSYTVEMAVFNAVEEKADAAVDQRAHRHILFHENHLESVPMQLIKPSRIVNPDVNLDNAVADVFPASRTQYASGWQLLLGCFGAA